MKIVADLDKCQGHGLYRMSAPDVYDVTVDEGQVIVKFDGDVPEEPRGRRRPGCRLLPGDRAEHRGVTAGASWRAPTWVVALLALVLLGTAIVVPTLVGLLSVELSTDLEFGETGLGLAVSAFWAVTALAAPVAGRAADVRGWPHVAALGAVVTGGCLVGAAILVDSWAALVVVMMLAGVGYALCSPTSNLLVVRMAPLRRRASVLGFKQCAPPLLMAVAGASLPAIASRHGWRWSMALGAVLPIAVLAALGWLRAVGAAARRSGDAGTSRASDPCGRAAPPRWRRCAPCRSWRPPGLGTLSVATLTGFAVSSPSSPRAWTASRRLPVVSAGSLAAVLVRLLSGGYLDSRPVDDLRLLYVVMGLAVLALALVGIGLFGVDRRYVDARGAPLAGRRGRRPGPGRRLDLAGAAPARRGPAYLQPGGGQRGAPARAAAWGPRSGRWASACCPRTEAGTGPGSPWPG